MYIILAVFIFGLLIAVHELGHFLAAKACGVRVNEFAIGMGPELWSRQRGETFYSLRALPIGGFCAMEGEDEDSDDPRSFNSQSGLRKFIILVAGSAMNFLCGLLIILLIFSQAKGFNAPVITEFYDGCPYESQDAFMVGDRFYKVNGQRTYFAGDVSVYMARNGGSDLMDVVIIRDGEKIELNDYKMTLLEYERNGQKVMRYGFSFGLRESGPLAVIKYSWYQAMDFMRLVWIGLADLITGGVGINDMAGVVGVVDIMNTAGEEAATVSIGVGNVLYLGAFIAINLAVMNLLPIPALDGGRVLFLFLTGLIEFITRKKVPSKYEAYINTAGFAFLMALMVVIMFNDVVRIIRG